MIVYVSYIPRLRRFAAHRDGLGEICGSDLQQLHMLAKSDHFFSNSSSATSRHI
jgi:hypothetical protein